MLNVDSINLLHLLNNKAKGFIEEINGNKYLTLVPNDVSNGKLKPYKVLRNNVKDLIKVIIINANNYDEKHMNIKFNSDDDLLLKKILKSPRSFLR